MANTVGRARLRSTTPSPITIASGKASKIQLADHSGMENVPMTSNSIILKPKDVDPGLRVLHLVITHKIIVSMIIPMKKPD